MKKQLILALAAMFALAAPAQAGVLRSNANGVNVRVGPGTNRAIIGHLDLNERVVALRNVGTWTRVKLPNGRVAYVDHTYLSAVVPVTSRKHKYKAGKYERVAVAKQNREYVWFDSRTHLYHSAKYGPTAHGGYMTVQQARALGGHPDR